MKVVIWSKIWHFEEKVKYYFLHAESSDDNKCKPEIVNQTSILEKN